MSVAYYFDHNMQTSVVTALRERGIDVLTTLEDRYDHHPDEEVLRRALELSRVVVTHDQDFLDLANEYLKRSQIFPGVVFCHLSKSSIGTLVEDLALIAEVVTYEELLSRVTWVSL